MKSYFIDSKLTNDVIKRNKEYNSSQFQEYKLQNVEAFKSKAIEAEATQHSIRLEKDLEAKSIYLSPNLKNIKIPNEEFLKQIENAQNYVREEWKKNKSKSLTPQMIKGVAGIINGGWHILNYREMGVRPTGAKTTPPYPAKIELEMNRFINNYNFLETAHDRGDISAMDLAFYTHLHIARIHPFEDGNGRTARTLQNLLLEKDKLPPAVIFRGERDSYHKLLDDAVLGYRNRDGHEQAITSKISNEEKELYNFLATKTNIALDLILEGSFDKLIN